MPTPCIYAITNTATGRVYIGQSRQHSDRWAQHRVALNRGTHTNSELQHDWSYYGADVFEFRIVEVVAQVQDLDARERHYITHTGNVYNALVTTEDRKPLLQRIAEMVRVKPRKRSTFDMFWSKVDRGPNDEGDEQGCWNWTGSLDSKGYGKVCIDKVMYGAHRVAWEFANERAPNGVLCHRCDNRKCVRPSHLFEGTAADNARDMREKGRVQSGEQHHTRRHPERVARGEQGSNAALTWAQVREIRALYATGGYRLEDLASRYGVGFSAIGKIVRNERWKE